MKSILISLALIGFLALNGYCVRPYTQLALGLKVSHIAPLGNNNGSVYNVLTIMAASPIRNSNIYCDWNFYGLYYYNPVKWENKTTGISRLGLFYGLGFEALKYNNFRVLFEGLSISFCTQGDNVYFIFSTFGLGWNFPLAKGNLIKEAMISFELPIITYLR